MPVQSPLEVDIIRGQPILKPLWVTFRHGESLQLSLLAAPLGILCGYAAVLLIHLIQFFQNLFIHQQISFAESGFANHALGWKLLLVPALGGVLVGLVVYFFAPEAKGHGVPEVMEAMILREGRIRPRVVLGKAVASSLCIASGGSTGREGPIVQIGSALGSAIGQWTRLNPTKIRVLVGCGAAASVAATFNTPIAGVIFAVEVLLFEFKTRSFVPLVIATVFATIVSRIHLGNQPAFHVPAYSFKHPVEIGFYLILGLAGRSAGSGDHPHALRLREYFRPPRRCPISSSRHWADSAWASSVWPSPRCWASATERWTPGSRASCLSNCCLP